jgi:hypothetical protein
VTISANAVDLLAGYEALRAQALGAVPAATPRGLSVLTRAGLAGWMCALAPTGRASTTTPRVAARESTGFGSELASLLTEMALCSQGRRVA